MKLTTTQITAFMEYLGINPEDRPTIENLRKIVQNFLEIVPFQNLTMLIGPMRRPTWDEICQEMLCGNGGLCTTRNPFLKVLLSHLGYTVNFVSASMEKPDCHIGILVRLDDVDYWVDVGNGYPYVEPYPLGSKAVVSHPFFDYRVIESEGNWQVQHRFNDGQWRTNQTFENRAVAYEFFDEMHEHHYKEIGWGLFLPAFESIVGLQQEGSFSEMRKQQASVNGQPLNLLKIWADGSIKPFLKHFSDLNRPLRKHGTYIVTENRS